jgi:tetratricopeptide (TPR) repeat protein
MSWYQCPMGFFDRWFSKSPPAATREQALLTMLEAGSTLHQRERFAEALVIFRRLIDEATAVDHRPLMAAGHQRAGAMLDMLGETSNALAELKKALDINLGLEGRDGPTVRQDHYTIGIVLARAGDVAGAEASLLESVRVARVVGDHEAASRGLMVVAQLQQQRGALAEALTTLWPIRPGATEHPRTLSAQGAGPLLVGLLAELGRHDDIGGLCAGVVQSVGYWQAKVKMGAIDDDDFAAVMQYSVDTLVDASLSLHDAGRGPDAHATLEVLSRMLGPAFNDTLARLRARIDAPPG